MTLWPTHRYDTLRTALVAVPRPRATSPKTARWLVFLAYAALGLGGCSGEKDGPVSAGSQRERPAAVTDTGVVTNDTGTGASRDTSAASEPVDTTLREGVHGTLTLVIDGDTVHVTVGGWYHTVRVQGINAPECLKERQDTANGDHYICTSDDEYWGLAAAEALTTFTDVGVTVRCEQSADGLACPMDYFDRFLAFLETDSGVDLGEWMAENGHAFSYTKFPSSRRATYCAAEAGAIAANRGMWASGSVSSVLNQMSDETQSWYDDHDRLCTEAN